MVEEVGYTSRVRVQAGAPLPDVSAASMGAGVGDAMTQAGAVIQQEQLEDARLDRQLRDNAEWSAFLVEDARAREDLSAMARDGRNSDDPGHAKRIADQIARREEALLGMVSSERLRQQGKARIAEWGGSLRAREADWEFLRGQEIVVENFAKVMSFAEGEARAAKTPLEYDKVLNTYVSAVRGLAVSDELKGKIETELRQKVAIGYVRGITDRDPEGALKLLDDGVFGGIMTGDQVEVLRNGAAVEKRRVDAQREREQAEAVANIRSQIATFQQAEAMGLVQDDAAYDSAITAATALGDEKLVLQLTGLKANSAFTKVWGPQNATALQREQRIGALASKGKLAPEEILELEFLRTHAPSWASEEARDPVGQASRRGGNGAPPPLDFSNPETIKARGQWAATRRMPAFTETEARELRKTYESGRPGEEQVMAVLTELPRAQAAASARQIDPTDRTLPVIVTLPSFVRNQARRGREALKVNPKLLSDTMRDDPDLSDYVDGENRAIEDALRMVPPEQRKAIRETAMQIAAGQIDKTGRPLTKELWTESLKFALGGRVVNGEWRGGYARWNDDAFLLPEDGSRAGFQGAVMQDVQTSKDPPVNPDGSTANLFRLRPVVVGRDANGRNIYEFQDNRGAAVRRKSGGVYQIVLRAK